MLDRNPMKRSPGSRQESDQQVRTVCQECTVNCGLSASIKDGRVVDIQGDENHPISRGRLCARGTAFVQGITLPERLAAPALRKKPGSEFQPFDDWKTGLDALAQRLRQVKEKSGPDSLLIGCDAEGGLDFYLGALRFAELWGTSQVFHSSGRRLDAWPDGLESPTAPCSEWIHSRCLLLVEADLAATHPVAFSWVQEAQRRGAQIVAADARFTATLAKADHALVMKPGQGNLLGLAITKLMLSEGALAAGAAEAALTDLAGWQASFEKMSLDGAEAALGLSMDQLQHVARLLAKSGPVTVITGRALANLPHHRTWLTLAAAMGWRGRPGGGWYPVEAGVPSLPVHTVPAQALPMHGEPEGTNAHNAGRPAPPLPALKEQGKVTAAICSGNSLRDHLSPFGGLANQLELVVHFGSFPNATDEQASFSFPAALWAEQDNLVFSDDRSVHWSGKIVEPPAGCRTGLDFWVELARRFGWEAHFPWATEDGRADHAAFYSWLLAQSPLTAGLQLDALRSVEPGARVFWPATAGAALEKIAPHLAPATLASAPEPGAAAEYPLSLLTAQSSCRSGDASHFWPWTRNFVREDSVQIHPDTALLLGIENGDDVLVDTPRGALPARANLSRTVPRSGIASFRGVNGMPALVHKVDQLPDSARNLLKKSTP